MQDYISKHRPEWEELEALVHRADHRGWHLRRLTPEELSRLDVLYRRTVVQLAQVASRTQDAALLRYLNDLTAAAHVIIYLPPRTRSVRNMVQFVFEGFPRGVARMWRHHALSLVLFLTGCFLGYGAALQDPAATYALLPANEFRQPGASREQLLRYIEHGRDISGAYKFAFSSFLFAHNLKIGFLAMTLGVLAAVPTVLLILYNGMVLGAFTAVHHQAGLHYDYWAWILPHGVTELAAIILCGGLGLQMGEAMLCPGLLSRKDSLRQAGANAVGIVLGVGGMLLFAAIVESYLRQSHLSNTTRYLFAFGTGIFWLGYFGHGAWREWSSRSRDDEPIATSSG
ncbi:MAG: stage II sporulation protein M [Planctomycetota bacterium]